MAPIGLVIFDCDGVLVDSEPLAMRVLLGLLGEQGIEIDRARKMGRKLVQQC